MPHDIVLLRLRSRPVAMLPAQLAERVLDAGRKRYRSLDLALPVRRDVTKRQGQLTGLLRMPGADRDGDASRLLAHQLRERVRPTVLLVHVDTLQFCPECILSAFPERFGTSRPSLAVCAPLH